MDWLRVNNCKDTLQVKGLRVNIKKTKVLWSNSQKVVNKNEKHPCRVFK